MQVGTYWTANPPELYQAISATSSSGLTGTDLVAWFCHSGSCDPQPGVIKDCSSGIATIGTACKPNAVSINEIMSTRAGSAVVSYNKISLQEIL